MVKFAEETTQKSEEKDELEEESYNTEQVVIKWQMKPNADNCRVNHRQKIHLTSRHKMKGSELITAFRKRLLGLSQIAVGKYQPQAQKSKQILEMTGNGTKQTRKYHQAPMQRAIGILVSTTKQGCGRHEWGTNEEKLHLRNPNKTKQLPSFSKSISDGFLCHHKRGLYHVAVGHLRNKPCFGEKKLATEELGKRRREDVVKGLGKAGCSMLRCNLGPWHHSKGTPATPESTRTTMDHRTLSLGKHVSESLLSTD